MSTLTAWSIGALWAVLYILSLVASDAAGKHVTRDDKLLYAATGEISLARELEIAANWAAITFLSGLTVFVLAVTAF